LRTAKKKRRSKRKVNLGLETMKRGCRLIRTYHGGIVNGCYTSKGFRFQKVPAGARKSSKIYM
jgi:hypothetical protein